MGQWARQDGGVSNKSEGKKGVCCQKYEQHGTNEEGRYLKSIAGW